MEIAGCAAVVVTVTLAVAVPVLPAASRKRNVTAVVPGGKSVLLLASCPLTCGARRAGAGSRLSVAVPPARNAARAGEALPRAPPASVAATVIDRKSTRLNSSHLGISYAV